MTTALTPEERDELVSTLRSAADELVSRTTSYRRDELEKPLLRMYATVALRVARRLAAPGMEHSLAPEDVRIVVGILKERLEQLDAAVTQKEGESAARLNARILTLCHAVAVLEREDDPLVIVPASEGAAVAEQPVQKKAAPQVRTGPAAEPRLASSRRRPPRASFRHVGPQQSSRRRQQRRTRRKRERSRAITLRSYCSGTPAGGLALLRFVRRGTSTEAWFSCDLAMMPLERVRRWRDHPDARALVQWVAGREDIQNGGNFVDDCRVSGLKGLWAELLILAFNGGDDGTNELARALLGLNDAELRRLRRHLGSLTSADASEQLSSVLAEEELDLPPSALLKMLATPSGRHRLEELRLEVAAKEKREAQKAPHAAAEYERLKPAIERALERARADPTYRLRLRGLSNWLDRSVRSTGQLPRGRVRVGRVPFAFNAFDDVGTVDFDALFREEPSSVSGSDKDGMLD